LLNYDWNFGRLLPYFNAFLSGIETSILLAVATIFFSTSLGIMWGILIERNTVVRVATTPILDILKSLPPLVIVLFGYFFLAQNVIGFTVTSFFSFVISLSLNQAAFIADLTRAAISNVPRDFIELGKAIGLRDSQILLKIITPIAIREALPPLSYLWIDALKLTSLASVVNVREMVFVAQDVITNSYRSLEVWIVVSIVYIFLIWPTSTIVRHMELRLKRSSGLDTTSHGHAFSN
jgi:His/Glu/Gln/Arg/opine family amino acid ABC transporter permease subunit